MKKPDTTIINAIEKTHEVYGDIPKDVIYTIMVYIFNWCYIYMVRTANEAIPTKTIFINGFGKFVPRIYSRGKIKKTMNKKVEECNIVNVKFRKVANYYT